MATASDTLWMQDGTDQFIDRAIGMAGAACGIGLSLKIVGWVAGAQDLDPVGYWPCASIVVTRFSTRHANATLKVA